MPLSCGIERTARYRVDHVPIPVILIFHDFLSRIYFYCLKYYFVIVRFSILFFIRSETAECSRARRGCINVRVNNRV